MRYIKKKVYVWSVDLAYAVGLLASDGCLSSDGRHIDLTSTDYEQLTNFNKAISKDLRITEKKNQSPTKAYRVQFSDVALYDFLIQAGLTPRKSKTIKKVILPDRVYGDFLRGLFDGDGSTYSYYDPRWSNSYVFYTSITSASKNFLEFLAKENQRICNIQGNSIRIGAGAYSLVYGKADSEKLYKLMYPTGCKLYLNRKKSKLESFFKENINATIARQK